MKSGFVDLQEEVSSWKFGSLPSVGVAVCGVGGIPITKDRGSFSYCSRHVPDAAGAIARLAKESLGLSGMLTFCNPNSKSYIELGESCLQRRHLFAFRWFTLSFYINLPDDPSTELLFLRDGRFRTSWVEHREGSLHGNPFVVHGTLADFLYFLELDHVVGTTVYHQLMELLKNVRHE